MMRWLPALGAMGCATAGTFQTAHTVGPGGWEAGGDASVLYIVDLSSDVPYLPIPHLSGRVGVSERTELGGSVGIDGLKTYAKVQLTNVDDEGVVVSVLGGTKVLPLPANETVGALLGAEEAVLVGIPTGDVGQVVFVGRGAQDFGFVGENRAVLIWAGGGVGWSYQVDDRFRLMPEVGAMTPVWGVDGGRPNDATGPQSLIIQVGLGAAFGQRR
jgi:hypothetical protein